MKQNKNAGRTHDRRQGKEMLMEGERKPTRVGGLVSHLAHEIRRALDARIAADVTPELTGARGRLLGDIVHANREGRPVYQRDVEEWYHIRRSSVTAMLKGMEQDGFITRCAVERDARLKSLFATEKGVAYFDRILNCIAAFEETLQQDLAPADLDTTKTVLAQMLRNLEDANTTGT